APTMVRALGAGEPMKHVWPPKRHVIRLSSVNGRSSQRTLSGWPTAHGRRSLLDRAEPELDDGSQRVPHRPQKPVAEAGRISTTPGVVLRPVSGFVARDGTARAPSPSSGIPADAAQGRH